MFATTAASFSARLAGLVIVVVAAAVIGSALGAILTDAARDGRTNAGYPIGWNGGARVPVGQTATAQFSQSALDAVKVTRGEMTLAAPTIDKTDYPLRHPAPAAVPADADAGAESDYHQRHAPASRDDGASTRHNSNHPQLE